MNMSEDVTAVSMQVSEKAAEAALSAFKSVLDSVGRLFRELLGIPAVVIDEDGESAWEPEPEDIADVHYYDTPDDIPAKLEDLAGEELEVQLRSVEIYSNNTEKSGDPDDLTGFSFDLMT